MFSIKNLLSMSVVAVVASSAAFADDTATTTPDASATSKKEGMGKKIEHAPGAAAKDTKKGAEAVVKDTEGGVKAVGRGTKKMVTGTGHEMGKLTHLGHKKKADATSQPGADTPAATPATDAK